MSWAIWITGVPASGKSTLARAAAEELVALGEPVRMLELDAIRKVLTPTPTYTETERDVVYRCLVYMATMLTEARVPVIIDATAHRRVWRELGRASIPRFAEVQLRCPIHVARHRERRRPPGHAPTGIYRLAGRPGATVPGVDVPYEASLSPELVVDTAAEAVSPAVAKVVALARRLAFSAFARPATLSTRWAIWITGLPGSGKTTLALALAETLSARGVPVTVVDMARLRRAFLPAPAGTDDQNEIAYRALVYTAKILTDSGVAAILDAPGARRPWRELARALIGHFAEVQLLCPRELCLERERAIRWKLVPGGPSGAGGIGDEPLEIIPDFERSPSAELTLHTDVQDRARVVEEALCLVQRLHRAATVHHQPLRRRA